MDPKQNDLDRRIWEEELEPFVPECVFDVHTHVFRWEFDTNPPTGNPYLQMVRRKFPVVGSEELREADAVLLPGRRVRRLTFPFPFSPDCDFKGANAWAAMQASAEDTNALMLVHPSMKPEEVDADVEQGRFLGFKPYRFYSTTGDAVECRITDFLPERLLEVADSRGLLVMLHLSKRAGVADRENLVDLERLSERFQNVKWILAHAARSYYPRPIREAAPVLRRLPQAWFDVSSVCDSDAVRALLDAVGIERVMYGSDDLPVGAVRGKYVTFGHAWAFLGQENHSLNLDHCDGRMTFVRYEQLRAMVRALAPADESLRRVFHDNAAALVDAVRASRR